jgi:hypothetical protein
MDFSSFLPILKPFEKLIGAVAPTIAMALGGPLAGNAVTFLCNALGVTTESELQKQLTEQSPDTLVKIKQIELDYQKHLKDIGVDLERIAAGDRDSARNREIQTRDWFPSILGTAITIGFFGLIALLIFHDISSSSNKDLINIMVGSLGTAWISVVTYYFGSSAGSDAKNRVIALMSSDTSALANKLAKP